MSFKSSHSLVLDYLLHAFEEDLGISRNLGDMLSWGWSGCLETLGKYFCLVGEHSKLVGPVAD